MLIEPIIRRKFFEADRAELQENIIARVEADPNHFLEKYKEHPSSFQGRYICSDLFKELFGEYTASKESRARYNAVIHNSAAVLAAKQFKRILTDNEVEGKEFIFLTGIPGAGKTSSVSAGGDLPKNCKGIFEGQLSRPETTIPKLQEVLDAGLSPIILVVHALPEEALANTFKRFNATGRGASINVMAEIQGNLPSGLKAVYDHFGEEAIQLAVLDYRDRSRPVRNVGWESNIKFLQSEGNHEQIQQRLNTALEAHKRFISDDCYRQARGFAPLSRNRNVVKHRDEKYGEDESERRILEKNDQQVAVDHELEAKAAQVLDIERTQRYLLDSEEKYNSGISLFVAAKQQEMKNIFSDLDKSMQKQEDVLNGLKKKKPRFFGVRRWKKEYETAKAYLKKIEKEKSQLIKKQKTLEADVTELFRKNNPDVTADRDKLVEKRVQEQAQERQKKQVHKHKSGRSQKLT